MTGLGLYKILTEEKKKIYKEIFNQADVNKDGVVSVPELKLILEKSNIGKDKNKSYSVASEDELREGIQKLNFSGDDTSDQLDFDQFSVLMDILDDDEWVINDYES